MGHTYNDSDEHTYSESDGAAEEAETRVVLVAKSTVTSAQFSGKVPGGGAVIYTARSLSLCPPPSLPPFPFPVCVCVCEQVATHTSS